MPRSALDLREARRKGGAATPPSSSLPSGGAPATHELGACRNQGRSMAKSSFKLEHPLERWQAEASRIREKYSNRIPVIIEKAGKSAIPDIDKKKEEAGGG